MHYLYENRQYHKHLNIETIKDITNLTYPTHSQNDYEIVYVEKGEINIGVNNNCVTMREGQFLFINRGDIHYYYTEEDKKSVIVILVFPVEKFTDLIINYSFFTKSISEKCNEILTDIINETTQQHKDFDIITKCLITQLLIEMQRNSDKNCLIIRTKSELLISKIYEYIDNNFTSNISNEKTAKRFHISVSTLYRILKETSGKSFADLIKIKKLVYARNILETTDLPITEIALNSGFDNTRTFNLMRVIFLSE
jgi:AraC-like DNA-binding protein